MTAQNTTLATAAIQGNHSNWGDWIWAEEKYKIPLRNFRLWCYVLCPDPEIELNFCLVIRCGMQPFGRHPGLNTMKCGGPLQPGGWNMLSLPSLRRAAGDTGKGAWKAGLKAVKKEPMTYTPRSPPLRSSPPPWSWCFPGAAALPRSAEPGRGPLPWSQSHSWHAGGRLWSTAASTHLQLFPAANGYSRSIHF